MFFSPEFSGLMRDFFNRSYDFFGLPSRPSLVRDGKITELFGTERENLFFFSSREKGKKKNG